MSSAPFAMGNDQDRFKKETGAIGSTKISEGARMAKREMIRPSQTTTCPWEQEDDKPVANKSTGQEVGVTDADTKRVFEETMAARRACEQSNACSGGAAACFSWD